MSSLVGLANVRKHVFLCQCLFSRIEKTVWPCSIKASLSLFVATEGGHTIVCQSRNTFWVTEQSNWSPKMSITVIVVERLSIVWCEQHFFCGTYITYPCTFFVSYFLHIYFSMETWLSLAERSAAMFSQLSSSVPPCFTEVFSVSFYRRFRSPQGCLPELSSP